MASEARAWARSAPAQVAAGQQTLVDLDGTLHLAGLAQQAAQNLQHLDGVRVLARDLGQLADRELHLPGRQVVQALGVVRRSCGRRAGPRGRSRRDAAAQARPASTAGDGGDQDSGQQRGVRHLSVASR